ncbi:MAG: hypothetical protein WCJ35_21345 [Planctomycetota bacterium]
MQGNLGAGFGWVLSRRTLIVLAVLLVFALLLGVIPRMLAWPFQAASSSKSADYFCIHGNELSADGFQAYDVAAEWHGKPAGRKILVLLPHVSRIVEIGAVRSFEQTCLSELIKRGVPSADVWPIRADALNVWGEAHALSEWLKAHPESTVRIACSPFSSGQLRYVFRKILGPIDSERVGLAILLDPKCRVESWWQSRAGVKGVMYGWLELIYAWAKGNEAFPEMPDAATFQHEIRTQIGEAPL